MPKYFTEATAITEKFLFISYSHEDKKLVHNSVNWLINEGVRLWYDADLHNGDNWIEIAKRMIEHENCIGTIFFNSLNSYISDPVAEERKLSLDKKAKWEKEGKTFHTFVVNIGKPSTMRLIKQVFDSLPDNDAVIHQAISSSQLSVILELFDDSRIYSYLDIDDSEKYLSSFFDDLQKRAPEVIDKGTIALEEMEKISKNSGISFKMGKYKINGETTSLEWQFVSCTDNIGVFILRELLSEQLGSGLADWLNGEFKSAAFTEEEKGKISTKIRLLTLQETKGISPKLMQCEKPWWLSDTNGAKQMYVRDDGTVNENGSVNTRVHQSVRPVILIDMNLAKELMK